MRNRLAELAGYEAAIAQAQERFLTLTEAAEQLRRLNHNRASELHHSIEERRWQFLAAAKPLRDRAATISDPATELFISRAEDIFTVSGRAGLSLQMLARDQVPPPDAQPFALAGQLDRVFEQWSNAAFSLRIQLQDEITLVRRRIVLFEEEAMRK